MTMLELFADLPPPAPRPAPASARAAPPALRVPVCRRTPNSIAWERVLAELPPGEPTLHVSALWTGVVLEIASSAAAGRRARHVDGTIHVMQPNTGEGLGRHVFLSAVEAQALHARHPLVCIGTPGTVSGRFRPAAPGQDTAGTIPLLAQLAAATKGTFV